MIPIFSPLTPRSVTDSMPPRVASRMRDIPPTVSATALRPSVIATPACDDASDARLAAP